jgi:hypothetical protein
MSGMHCSAVCGVRGPSVFVSVAEVVYSIKEGWKLGKERHWISKERERHRQHRATRSRGRGAPARAHRRVGRTGEGD